MGWIDITGVFVLAIHEVKFRSMVTYGSQGNTIPVPGVSSEECQE